MDEIKKNDNLDVCFLGGIYPKIQENEIIKNSKTGIANAANNLQWKYIKGLDLCLEKPPYIINSMYVGSYPKYYKKSIINSYEFSHTGTCTDHNVGFLNIYGIKNYIRYFKLKPYLKNWANQENNEKSKVIFAYAMTYTFLKSLSYIKKCNSNIETCLIVPDLPQFMNTSNNQTLIYKILKKIEIYIIKKNMKYVDKFILLTEQMSKKLEIKETNYMVIEGMIDCSKDEEQIVSDIIESIYIFDKNSKYICYTGTLNEKYGIKNLVETMSYLKNKNIKLLVCGRGDSEDFVQKSAINNKNIIYLGDLPYELVSHLLKQCHILVNPRTNEGEYTKYSFPSKTMDYILSGIPTIMFKLDGIPDEYDNYLNYFSSTNPDDMAKDISDLLENYEDSLIKAKYGKTYILEKKNNFFLINEILNNL